MQKITKNHILASDGMTLVRISNGEVMGKELFLGKTYYVGGERVDPPIVEVASNFSEITDEEAEYQQYTYKATNAVEAVVFLYDVSKWAEMSDDDKQAIIEKYGGVGSYTYDTLVTMFIRVKYDADKMEAVVNNYLAEPTNRYYASDWQNMQSWRTESKTLAKEMLALSSNP